MRHRTASVGLAIPMRAWRRRRAAVAGAVIVSYLGAIAIAWMMVGIGAGRIAAALLPEAPLSAPTRPNPTSSASTAPEPPAATPAAPAILPVTPKRHAFMSTTADAPGRITPRAANTWIAPGMPLRRPIADEGDDDEPRAAPVYRTLCVRTCDGYYFPISNATSAARLAGDAQACQAQCSGGRLFVHRVVGEGVEQMVDLQGKPYTQLPNAFLYRTQYVNDCKCKPDPWEPEAKEKHRVYALIDAARKGNRDAQVELKALEKSKPGSLPQVASRPQATDVPLNPAPTLNGEKPMGLGFATPPKSSPGSSLPDWARRAFNNY